MQGEKPSPFSHLLPQEQLWIACHGWIEKLKMLTQNFFLSNGKEVETDSVELSRRKENKLAEILCGGQEHEAWGQTSCL